MAFPQDISPRCECFKIVRSEFKTCIRKHIKLWIWAILIKLSQNQSGVNNFPMPNLKVDNITRDNWLQFVSKSLGNFKEHFQKQCDVTTICTNFISKYHFLLNSWNQSRFCWNTIFRIIVHHSSACPIHYQMHNPVWSSVCMQNFGAKGCLVIIKHSADWQVMHLFSTFFGWSRSISMDRMTLSMLADGIYKNLWAQVLIP